MQMANSRWHMVKPIFDLRFLISGLCALLFALSVAAQAQQPKKVARIGYLVENAALSATDLKPFHDRMRELGYVEGGNIVYEPRYWEGKAAR
jgi:hypothetical protein